MQQAGRGGRAGAISDSIIILLSSSSRSSSRRFPALRAELVNIYSVEAEDEAVLSEYLESSSYRRIVLARYLDSYLEAISYITTNSILYN
jgi:superfamily II DNA helicase RecQ